MWGQDPGAALLQWWPAAAPSVPMPVTKKNYPDSNILGSSYCGDGVNLGSSIFDRHKGAGSESSFEAARKSVPANSSTHIKLFQILESCMRMSVVPAQVHNDRQNSRFRELRKMEGSDHSVTPWIATRPWLQGFYPEGMDYWMCGAMTRVATATEGFGGMNPAELRAKKSRDATRASLVHNFNVTYDNANAGVAWKLIHDNQRFAKKEIGALRHYAMQSYADFPDSPHIQEIARGRSAQAALLTPFLDKIGDQIRREADEKPEDQQQAWMVASWKMFIDGFAARGALTKEVDKDIEALTAKFGQASGGLTGGASPSSSRSTSTPQGLCSGGGGSSIANNRLVGTVSHVGTPPRRSTVSGKNSPHKLNVTEKRKQGPLAPVLKTHIPCSASVVGTQIGLECAKVCFKC